MPHCTYSVQLHNDHFHNLVQGIMKTLFALLLESKNHFFICIFFFTLCFQRVKARTFLSTGAAQTTEKLRVVYKTTGTSKRNGAFCCVFTVPSSHADDARRSALRRLRSWSRPRHRQQRCACNACTTRCRRRSASWNPRGRKEFLF